MENQNERMQSPNKQKEEQIINKFYEHEIRETPEEKVKKLEAMYREKVRLWKQNDEEPKIRRDIVLQFELEQRAKQFSKSDLEELEKIEQQIKELGKQRDTLKKRRTQITGHRDVTDEEFDTIMGWREHMCEWWEDWLERREHVLDYKKQCLEAQEEKLKQREQELKQIEIEIKCRRDNILHREYELNEWESILLKEQNLLDAQNKDIGWL